MGSDVEVLEAGEHADTDDQARLSQETRGHGNEDDVDYGELTQEIAKIVERSATHPGAPFEAGSLDLLLRQREEDPPGFVRTWDALKKVKGVNVGFLKNALDKLKAKRAAEQRKSHQSAKRHAVGDKIFRLTDRGVEKRFDSGSDMEWRWFCSRVEVLAETRDSGGRAWGRLLAVTTPEGQVHEWSLPMEMLAGDGNAYRAELLHLGLVMAPGKWVRDALHEYLSTWRPSERARCVDRIGWHGTAFVLPDATYGDGGGERVLLQAATSSHAFRVAGDLQEWQENVARYASGNSRLIFAISVAFAAPLLGLLDIEGGGFNLKGTSSTGKSTALCVAASVWGGGERPSYVRQWRATGNGLEGVAATHSDSLLCLDELGQVDGREAGGIAYMLANGAGKSRARRDGSGRPPAEWRVLFLSTGEIGLADKVHEDGRKRAAAGQQVRVVDIPADAGAGLGVFEELHGFTSADAFAVHLKSAAGTVYGTPIREFLGWAVEHVQEIKDRFAEFRKEFEIEHLPPNAQGQVSRVLARVALVAFAGELAAQLDILPWQHGEATSGVAACFESWLGERGGTGPSEVHDGIAQVRAFIERYGESHFSPWERGEDSNRLTVDRAGFRKKTDDGSVFDYYVLPEAWKKVCKGFDAGLVARALLKQGHLVPDSKGAPQSPHHLPGMGQKRCYYLRSSILEDDNA